MSRPAKPSVVILVGSVIALSVLLVVFAWRGKRSVPAPIETEDPGAAAAPRPPTEPAAKPLPPVPVARATSPGARAVTRKHGRATAGRRFAARIETPAARCQNATASPHDRELHVAYSLGSE